MTQRSNCLGLKQDIFRILICSSKNKGANYGDIKKV